MRDASDLARPSLPPPFEPVRHDGPGPVLERAVVLAPELGAGTLVWGVRAGVLAFAVVLEPDRPLAEARPAHMIGMAAAAEALAAHCPPERSVAIAWPDALVFDGARLGGGALVWPDGCAEDADPGWLVFGVELLDRRELTEPGLRADSTSLEEEGFGDRLALVESFARHLMLFFDTWSATGPAAAMQPYLDRLDGPRLRRRIEVTGDLVERDAAGVARRLALVPALGARAWADPARGGPRL